MKQFFLYIMAVMIPLAAILWLVMSTSKSFWGLFKDWRLGKELDELQSQSAERKRQRDEMNRKRLDNGCEHDFESASVGLPYDTCAKCGLHRDKPNGPCDHVWKIKTGAVAASSCVKCGKEFVANMTPETFA